MILAIFDIDGTLLRSNRADEIAFLHAFESLHGLGDISTDWGSYATSTDSGIADEIFRTRLGRAPEHEDIARLKAALLARLESVHAAEPQSLAPVAGAPELLAALRAHSGIRIAIATGAWRVSAETKLRLGGIDACGIPMATADDAHHRSEIVAEARRTAGAASRSLYIGDGAWDARAARKLGIGFLGIGGNGRDEKLRHAGAQTIIPDFADTSTVLDLIESLAQ